MAVDGKVGMETINFKNIELLNRLEFEGIPMTLDFAGISDTDATGKILIKAGTPISNAGVPVTEAPWTGAYGILLFDVYKDYPTGTIVRKGYINVTNAKTLSGITYTAALATAINGTGGRISLENPITV